MLSEIWDDIDRSMGSAVEIVLLFMGHNLKFENITNVMEMTPTKIIKNDATPNEGYSGSWIFSAFAEEEYDDLSIFEKAYKFAEMMDEKKEVINKLTHDYKSNTPIKDYLYIIGNPFKYNNFFSLPSNFITLAYNINASIEFRIHNDF